MAKTNVPESQQPDDLLQQPITEQQLVNARGILNELFGYHQGPRPRLGTRVRFKGEFGTVMGHATRGSLYVVLDRGARRTCRLSDLNWDDSPRTSLHAMLMIAAEDAASTPVDAIAAFNLVNHFRGDNGARYADRAPYLWSVRALCLGGVLGGETWILGRWLNREIEEEGGKSGLPPAMDGTLLAKCCTDAATGPWRAELGRLGAESIRAALDAGHVSLSLAASDESLQINLINLERRLAVDLATERQVVVIGTNRLVPGGDGFVQVIDLDTLSSYSRHLSGLDIGDDAMDHGWFWDVVTHSALKHPKSAATDWLSDNLYGPTGEETNKPERRIVSVLACLQLARRLSASDPAGSRRALKRSRDLSRTLDKAAKNRLVALAPELVAHDTRTLRLGTPEALTPSLKAAIEGMLEVLPAPENLNIARESGSVFITEDARNNEALDASTFNDLSDSPALSVDQSHQLPNFVPVSTGPAPIAAVAPVTRERIRFARPLQPLRFNFSEHLLFAMEWQLVDDYDAHAEAIATSLDWLEKRLGTSLPKTWREGAHEVDLAGVSLQIESASKLFAFRLDHPDVDHPTRWWRVEATVLQGRSGVGGVVGLRMHIRDLVDLPPPMRTVPALVRAWAENPGLILAGARAGHVAQIRDDDQLDRLDRIIRREDRQTPVLVTAAGGVRLPAQGPLAGLVRALIVDPTLPGYIRRFGAIATDEVHVFAPGEFRPRPFQAHGAEWLSRLRSLAIELRQNSTIPSFRDIRDAIHTFRTAPVVGRASDAGRVAEDVSDRPSESIQYPEHPNPVASRIDQTEHVFQVSSGAASEAEGPSLEDIQQIVRREVRDYEELLELAENERDEAVSERDQAQSELISLRHRVAQLQSSIQSGARVTTRPVPPNHLSEIGIWVPQLAPRVVFADKAIRTASRLEHSDVGKIYASLQALHDYYWAMRFSADPGERSRGAEDWRSFLLQNRLTYSQVGNAARTGRYQDEYRASIEGRTFVSTMHIAGSSAHDPLRCLRIYTDVDDDEARIIVIHLPTHLTNSLT